jgi:hypothetical protein
MFRRGNYPATGANKSQPQDLGLTGDQVEVVAQFMFDRANPDHPSDMTTTAERKELFRLTRDYWIRAAIELLEKLTATATVKCPCGHEVSGPPETVAEVLFFHKCEKTDPYWGKTHESYPY